MVIMMMTMMMMGGNDNGLGMTVRGTLTTRNNNGNKGMIGNITTTLGPIRGNRLR